MFFPQEVFHRRCGLKKYIGSPAQLCGDGVCRYVFVCTDIHRVVLMVVVDTIMWICAISMRYAAYVVGGVGLCPNERGVIGFDI